MTNEILINNRVNQITGATDWLTFTDAGFPDLPETYTIVDLDADRATDGGHYRNLYGIRLGKIPDPDTLRIFEYLADSNSDSFDSDSEAGAEYTRAASWPPAAGEFATSGNGDIVYFHASQVGVQVAVLPYEFRCTPLTIAQIRAFAEAAVSGSSLDALVDAAVDAAVDTAVDAAIAALDLSGSQNLYGFQNGTDADHDVNITIYKTDGTTSTITKQMDVEWVEGTNQGGMQSGQVMPASGVVRWLAISKDSDPSIIDFIGSPLTTLSAITIPTGWSRVSALDVFRMVTDSSSNFRAFYHDLSGGVVLLTGTLSLDLNVADQGTTRTTRTAVNVPERVLALRRSFSSCGSSHQSKVEATVHTDQAPSISGAALADHWSDSAIASSAFSLGSAPVFINASRQYSTDSTQANTTLYVQFYGWLWRSI